MGQPKRPNVGITWTIIMCMTHIQYVQSKKECFYYRLLNGYDIYQSREKRKHYKRDA